jgi:hypothetical protein
MPVKHALWNVGAQPTPLSTCSLPSEQLLEDMIVHDPRILSSEWMLIGRQENSPYAGRIDFLAIAPDGSLVLIELKKNRTPREIVAQAIDYAAWVESLTADKIAQIYQRFSNGGNLDEAFHTRFGVPLDEETLNESHQIILVATELDNASERIINYLNARDIAINVIFFQVFQHGADRILSRAWLIDPGETQANVVTTTKTKGPSEPWNGEFYASFGEGQHRTWEDGRKFGFISAGGGSWYSRTLQLLSPGDRVWVRIPSRGFVGVGRVTEAEKSVNDFTVMTPAGERPCLDVLQTGEFLRQYADDPEMAEHFVRVKWLDTVPEEQAFHEVGLFGNQNSVCQPSTPKWRHTVERLKTRFPNWNADPGQLDAK